VKNGLLAVARRGAQFDSRDVLWRTATAFVAFCCMASAIYLINDVRDVEADRLHPTKHLRAIASGELSIRLALTAPRARHCRLRLTLCCRAVKGYYYPRTLFCDLICIPRLKNLAISSWCRASGFFLRAYGGRHVAHHCLNVVPRYLLWRTFLVVGKRTSEMKKVGVKATRPVLAEYTLEFLRSALHTQRHRGRSGYCLWAFDTSSTGLSSTYNDFVPIRLTVVPVVFAVLFIMRSADPAQRAPEDLLLHTARSRRSPSSGSRSWRGESTDESRHALRWGRTSPSVATLDDVSSESEIAIALLRRDHHRAGSGAAT